MPHSTPAHEDAIRALAHAYWEAEGRPEGLAEVHWQRAVDAFDEHVEVQPSDLSAKTEGARAKSDRKHQPDAAA